MTSGTNLFWLTKICVRSKDLFLVKLSICASHSITCRKSCARLVLHCLSIGQSVVLSPGFVLLAFDEQNCSGGCHSGYPVERGRQVVADQHAGQKCQPGRLLVGSPLCPLCTGCAPAGESLTSVGNEWLVVTCCAGCCCAGCHTRLGA